MKTKPSADITVITPAIPWRHQFMERCAASVEFQTLQPQRHVVVLDADGLGAAATRNKALAEVDTEWVAFLDDDDEFLPHHLERLYREAQESDADLVYPWFRVVGGHDPLMVPVGGMRMSPLGVPFGEEQREYLLTVGNYIPITVLARTQRVLDVGGFQDFPGRLPNSATCEDWWLWRCLLEGGAKFHHAPDITWLWHHHGMNTSGRPWGGE